MSKVGSITSRNLVAELGDPQWRTRRARKRRVGNRRTLIQKKSLLVRGADGLGALFRALFILLRRLVLVGAVATSVAAVGFGGRELVSYIVDSSHFAVSGIDVSPTRHGLSEQLIALAEVPLGAPLLSLDPDAVAARVAQHPWVQSVQVRRRLPRTLAIFVTERKAVALANLGGLYLIDESGHPFKRAAMEETEGLVALTGVSRAQFVEQPQIVRAAYKQALALLRTYNARPQRPALSEINLHPRYGFTAYLRESGSQVRLGRGRYGEKLARLDQIVDSVVKAKVWGLSAVKAIHLDGDVTKGVSIRLGPGPSPGTPSR